MMQVLRISVLWETVRKRKARLSNAKAAVGESTKHSYEIICTMFNGNLELSAMRIPESSIAKHTETLKDGKFDPLHLRLLKLKLVRIAFTVA